MTRARRFAAASRLRETPQALAYGDDRTTSCTTTRPETSTAPTNTATSTADDATTASTSTASSTTTRPDRSSTPDDSTTDAETDSTTGPGVCDLGGPDGFFTVDRDPLTGECGCNYSCVKNREDDPLDGPFAGSARSAVSTSPGVGGNGGTEDDDAAGGNRGPSACLARPGDVMFVAGPNRSTTGVPDFGGAGGTNPDDNLAPECATDLAGPNLQIN